MQSALEITARASVIPRRYFRADFEIDHKEDKSPVTIADRETEIFIRDALKAMYPEHGIFGEEFGRETTDSHYEWVIDPIDGTRSFASGMPLYGMLLSLLRDGKPEFGIVRMPELDEVYTGDGIWANRNESEILHSSGTTSLQDAIVYLNEGEKISSAHPGLFGEICRSGRIMRLGYDCYPHMLLASGQVDLVFDFDIKPYDYFALVPIVEGAGGVISDWRGRSLDLQSDGRVVSAATPKLHRQALETIAAQL